MAKTTALTGASGEHYIAAYLSALELVVALPRGGVPSCDMLVTTKLAGKSVSIQVKTATSPLNEPKKDKHYYAWSTSANSVDSVHANHWFAFVNLNKWPEADTSPEIFFIPSGVVAIEVKKELEKGAKWLFYCIECDDAEQYRGMNGVNMLLRELNRQV